MAAMGGLPRNMGIAQELDKRWVPVKESGFGVPSRGYAGIYKHISSCIRMTENKMETASEGLGLRAKGLGDSSF